MIWTPKRSSHCSLVRKLRKYLEKIQWLLDIEHVPRESGNFDEYQRAAPIEYVQRYVKRASFGWRAVEGNGSYTSYMTWKHL